VTAAADPTPESTAGNPAENEAAADAALDESIAQAIVEEALIDQAIEGALVEEAILEEVIEEALVEEAVAEAVLEEAVIEHALLDGAIEAELGEEVPDVEAIEQALAVEEILEETIEEALVEEAVAEAVLEEAVIEHALLDEAIEGALAAEAILDEAIAGAVDEATAGEQSPAAPKPSIARSSTVTVPGVSEPWGRVDDDGTVSVREATGWRVVGQFPDGSREEALAYFERKFADLASEVGLLEVRHRRGGASAADLRSAARTVRGKLDGAAAVGDLAALQARLAALTQTLAAESETEAAAAREAVDDAVRARTEIVEKAEALAARDPRSVQWKQASAELGELFDAWQSQQQHGPRLPKAASQQLWKRFRDARATFDKHRREFYAELDEVHRGVRDRKTRLVEKAEALAPKGEDGIPAYRDLLDEWKSAGRAGKKADDALWARFKAAGDALYSARIERETADAEASREKIEARRALLAEAKAVADEKDLTKARTLLTGIQRRWDDIGRIFPREAERGLDDDLRRIENALRTREESDWKRNNPETKARANDMTRQLTEAIEKLEDELTAAKATGDKASIAKAAEALEARKSWLKALGG